MNKVNITGIVLAGGKSSRMGTDKSLLIYNGKTLTEHAINALRPLCGKIVISSGKPVYGFTGCETWPDALPQQAPINGLYSCLKRSETEVNIILSCDMPFAGTALLKYLLDSSANHEITVPVHDNRLIEPLCGIYKRSILPGLREFMGKDLYSLQRFIETCQYRYVEINTDLPFFNKYLFVNINTPDDLNQLPVDFS